MTRSFKLGAVIVLAAVLAGCGGGGSKTDEVAVPGTSGGTGRASVTIKWPATNRLIPAATKSITIDVMNGNRTLAHKVIARPPEGGTLVAVFDSLPEGDMLVTASACPDENGYSTPLAKGSATLTIVDGQESSIKITMDSTVESLDIQHYDSSFLQVGQSLQLYPHAEDKNGYDIVIADGSLIWSSSNPSAAIIDSTGKVTATGLGSTQISLTDTESGKQAAIDISTILNVSTDPQPQLLALNPVTNKIYVAHSADGGAVTEIDGATNTPRVIARAPLGYGYTFSGIAVDCSRNWVYVTCDAPLSSRLMLLDGGSGAVLQSTELVDNAEGIAVDESANRVYLTSAGSPDEAVTVVDGTDLHTISQVPLPENATAYAPAKLVLMPSRHTLYITSVLRAGYTGEPNPVFTLNTSGSPQLTVLTGVTSTSDAIAVDDSRNLVYVCSGQAVAAYTGAGEFVKQAYIGYLGGPGHLKVDSTRNRSYACAPPFTITCIDWSDGESVTSVPVNGTESIVVNEQTNRLYAAVWYNGSVAVVAMPE